MGVQYYDPQVGRFISRDAVLSEHPYLYCEHEPVMRVDPSGRFWQIIVLVVILATLPGCKPAPAPAPSPPPGEDRDKDRIPDAVDTDDDNDGKPDYMDLTDKPDHP